MRLFLCLSLLGIFSFASAQNNSSISFRIPLRVEWHTFQVYKGPPEPSIGLYPEQNFNWGIGAVYNKPFNKTNLYAGIDLLKFKSRIGRFVNGKRLDDHTAIQLYTTNTSYYLFSVPLGIDFSLNKWDKNELLIGTSLHINFSFLDQYQTEDHPPKAKSGIDFFGFNNQISVTYKRNISSNNYFSIRPFLTTFESWRKDEAFDENPNEFHRNSFNSVGMVLSFGINLK